MNGPLNTRWMSCTEFIFSKVNNYTLLRRWLPSFLLKLFNDIDLMEFLRLIGKEFQDITALKDILWDLYISNRGRGNLNRLLPLGHNVNSVLMYWRTLSLVDFIISNDLWKSVKYLRGRTHAALKTLVELFFTTSLTALFCKDFRGLNWWGAAPPKSNIPYSSLLWI